jgi:hypothetical protein
MKCDDIQVGSKYWVRSNEESRARPVLVLRRSEREPYWFQRVGAEGDDFIVFKDAFLRPVHAEASQIEGTSRTI